MAQLIQMRQQINAIETIKKITHAMRLISMSSHTKMANKVSFMQNYKKELLNLMNIIELAKKESSDFSDDKFSDITTKKKRTLIILIGSQKGLAGPFNSALFKYFDRHYALDSQNAEFIAVGKRAADFLKKKFHILKYYENFNLQNLYVIAKEIFELINKISYSDIIIYANYPKSFFAQIPEKNIILPIKFETQTTNSLITENYIWEQSVDEIADSLTKEYIHFSIQSLLFNSLFAEQSARFNSMDNATRNAEELLENLKRQYNKLRQAKITKEIAEVSSALL